jgi:hypothetical protein
MAKKVVFGLQRLKLSNFFHFFCDWQVTFMWESHLERKKMEKSLMTFLLLFNSLKIGRTSLFCCNGYSHAIFTILFYESQVEQLRKSFTKEKNEKKVLMTFLLLFYYIFMT